VRCASIADADGIIQKAREELARTSIDSTNTGGSATRGPSEPSLCDELTGVANRFRLDQGIVAAMEQTRHGVGPLSIALIEVDGLDQVRTQYGVDASDNVLISTASRLEESFKSSDVLIGRFEENRFAVVMPRIDRPAALKMCEAARLATAGRPLRLVAGSNGAPPTLSVSISIGLASLDANSIQRFDDNVALTNILEQALRLARKAGANAIRVYAPAAAA
jgi:diguanylate cyclase (GGDEF)-like protein